MSDAPDGDTSSSPPPNQRQNSHGPCNEIAEDGHHQAPEQQERDNSYRGNQELNQHLTSEHLE